MFVDTVFKHCLAIQDALSKDGIFKNFNCIYVYRQRQSNYNYSYLVEF